jgi:hypothetical protein
MLIFNGVPDDGKWHWLQEHQPSKEDHGHTAIQYGQKVSRMSMRRAVRCQCGKVYTGWGSRAIYSYLAHLRKEIEKR